MKTLINKKALQAKEKYYVSILLHCHYVWYVGRLNLCRVENVQLLLPKKNSCLGHVSVLLPGRPWRPRFFQPIHWVLK